MSFHKKFRRLLNGDADFKEILTKSSSSFSLRVLGLLINYFFLFFVTRMYGAEGWGVFALCFAILQITALFGSLGINVALVKLVAKGGFNLKSLYYNLFKIIIPFNILISFIIYILSDDIGALLGRDGVSMTDYIKISTFGILPFSISIINSGLFRGKKRILSFSFYDSLGRFLCGGLIVAIWTLFSNNIDVSIVIKGFVIGLYFLALFSILEVTRIIKSDNYSSLEEYKLLDLFKLGLPLFWSSFMNTATIYSVTLILGLFLTKEEVGLFDTVNRLASVLTIILYAVNSISAPKFSESSNNKIQLQKNVTHSSKIIFYSTLIILFPLMVFGYFILNKMGYSDFHESYILFLIILGGQIFNNFSGSVGFLMQMTGYHNLIQKISIISFIGVTIALALVSPIWGIFGAAIIVSLNIAFKNLLGSILIFNKTGIKTIYFPMKSFQMSV